MQITSADKRANSARGRDHFLFGCGVILELLKSYLFFRVAMGLVATDRPMSLEFILVSVGLLGFLLGVKGVYKCQDKDNNHDRYPGAWVAVMAGLFWFAIHFSYFTGFVKEIPPHFTTNLILIFGLLGITKGFDIWAIIASKFPIPRILEK